MKHVAPVMIFCMLACLLTAGGTAAEGEKTIFAHFYYWYPINAGICTHHAPEGQFDRDDVDWWKGQLRNAQHAGVDVLTLMYWDVHRYNPGALEVMVEAIGQMDAIQEPHPKVAMHLDGIEQCANYQKQRPVTLCDLREPRAQEGVARSFVNFFKFFQDRDLLDLCFRQDGKLVAFVYRPEYNRIQSFADNTWVDHCRKQFRDELGEELYVVLESAYYRASHAGTGTELRSTNADNYYAWDAALDGPLLESRGGFGVATIGPGFDPSGQGVMNRKLERRGGATFREAFAQAIRWNPPWLVIETFNFFEEGTDITETVEFGRTYLDIAREGSAQFKAAR